MGLRSYLTVERGETEHPPAFVGRRGMKKGVACSAGGGPVWGPPRLAIHLRRCGMEKRGRPLLTSCLKAMAYEFTFMPFDVLSGR